MAAQLSPLEVSIVELQNTPKTRVHAARRCCCSRRAGATCEFCTRGGGARHEAVTVSVHRSVPESEVEPLELPLEVLEPRVSPCVRLTRDGAEWAHRAERIDEAGALVMDEDRVVVEERLPIKLSQAEIAEQLGLSRRQLARATELLYAKIRRWVQAEAAASLERAA